MAELEPPLTDAQSVTDYLRRIWLGKAVGLIYEGYMHHVRVHTSLGEQYGRDDVVTDTVQVLAAFPNLRFRGERAVWTGEQGLYVSCLALNTALNSGYSRYGPPTGRRVCYRAATDLRIEGDRVAEVWQVHDGLGLVRRLGLDIQETVKMLSRQGPVSPILHGTGALEVRGQRAAEPLPRPSPEDVPEAFVSWVWHELWNRRRLDRVAEVYAPDYRFFGPSETRLRTREAFVGYALGLLATFPDATVQLEHVCRRDDHVAVRWRLLGTHDGPGRYGPPTGRRVNLLGVTHHRLQGEQLLSECTVFDELALLVQLHVPDDEPSSTPADRSTPVPSKVTEGVSDV